MSRHRADVRPRYGRIAVLGASVTVTVVALLGGLGVLPSSASDIGADAALVAQTSQRTVTPTPVPTSVTPTSVAPTTPAPTKTRRTTSSPSPSSPEPSSPPSVGGTSDTTATGPVVPLPADSGSGKRVVFSQADQRVWLVRAGADADRVVRTYLVSGSLTDNLDPGTYEVYSRSMHAVGVDDSGTMTHFVRFTQGPSGAAIGFHDIPVLDGKRIQSSAQLGTPRSHGCIRQRESDAVALWHFAHLGTTVVVTT